jgi:hypothetical protein
MRLLAGLLLLSLAPLGAAEKGFTQLFNGKDLTGWKVSSDSPETFSVKEGAIVAHGKRAHCFYVGKFSNHTFKNFELKVDVMTLPGANGGIYVDTQFQDQGWPSKGFEIQVNTSHADPRKSGSLYAVQDVDESTLNKLGVKDNEWFTERIVVKDDTITVYLNDKQVVLWKQPADWLTTKGASGKAIAPGTIALQGHDPGSTVYYKNIRIKPMK